MGSLKVKVCSAANIKNTDATITSFTGLMSGNKTDSLIVAMCENQFFQTKTVNDNLNPVWNEETVFKVSDPTTSVLHFFLWDQDAVTCNDLVAATAVTLNTLRKGEKITLSIPLVISSKESSGTLTVELTAVDFSGLSATVKQLDETRQRLETQVKALGDEVGELRGVREGLQKEVGKLTKQTEAFAAENAKLEATRVALDSQVGALKGQVNTLGEENNKLSNTRKALETQVGELQRQGEELKTQVKELQHTREALEGEVVKLGNQTKLLGTEVQELQKCRGVLEEQTQRQQAQNQQLHEELQKLHTVEEGLRAFAAQQGADYKQFVGSLTSSINKHKELLAEFAEENKKLKENRRKQQIESMLALANTFQNWDQRSGLDRKEFDAFLETLGPEVEKQLCLKLGCTASDKAFIALDKDKSGSLNVPELRAILEQLAEEK